MNFFFKLAQNFFFRPFKTFLKKIVIRQSLVPKMHSNMYIVCILYTDNMSAETIVLYSFDMSLKPHNIP